MGTLHYRDPGTGNWVQLATAGPAGADGPNEVVVSDTMPVDANVELWVDRDNDLGNSGWDALDSRYVNTAGDTMTGPLTAGGALAMANNKITGLGAATTGTDAMSQTASDARYVKTSGDGTITGFLTVSGPPTLAGHAATKSYVDGKVVISSTAPASPTVGQLWAQP